MKQIIENKIKLITMLIWQLVLPIVAITVPIWGTEQVLEIIVKVYETFSGNTCALKYEDGVIFGVVIVLGILFLIKYINKEKEFLPGNIYGSEFIIVYYIAQFLGYKKISLARKPYNVIFKIVLNKMFDIIDDNINTDSDVEAYVDYSNIIDSSNLRECNLIISDTYKIEPEQIPENKRDIDTIYVYREVSTEVNNRAYSPKLLSKIGESFERAQRSAEIINLYLTTNTKTTKEMIEKVLMKGLRSRYNIRIFLQKCDKKRSFRKWGILIKT